MLEKNATSYKKKVCVGNLYRQIGCTIERGEHVENATVSSYMKHNYLFIVWVNTDNIH